ncbi:MAG: succinate dehydrogenase assembly factor 2 [Acidiferrobacterales bacterium]|jgi:antitoxin CptB|nr:succinate dehydrogenase assembly factor 2 [Acidiferrobacterales bacterium]
MTADPETLRRLRWRCRRGLLELDLVFQRFLEHRYATLASDDKERFQRLLELQDNTLLAYLNGDETPDDPDLTKIIKKIV